MIFACPRVSPEWELGTLHALMKPKPQTRGAVEHRSGEQAWPAEGDGILADVLGVVRERLGTSLAVHRPAAGDYHLVADFAREQLPEVLAVALLLSRRLPELWFVVDRLFVHGGVFHRRQFGYKLNLVPASDVHIPRPIRAALRGVL
jgi:hypothetical protein